MIPPSDTEGNGNNAAGAPMDWREREQRQRSVRFMMMFLLMLLLMDGDEEGNRNRQRERERQKKKQRIHLITNQSIYDQRIAFDERIAGMVTSNDRYARLVSLNEGKDYDQDVRLWAEQQMGLEKDEFSQITEKETPANNEADKTVFHYPWNATGLYRGEWTMLNSTDPTNPATAEDQRHLQSPGKTPVAPHNVDDVFLPTSKANRETFGVYLLPNNLEVALPNVSHAQSDDINTNTRSQSHQATFLRGSDARSKTTKAKVKNPNQLTLTEKSGKIAFQLNSRSIPGIMEISLVDGFIKLYDSSPNGYSTHRDVLLPATGVLIHSIGRLSLVANAKPNRTVFAILSNNDNDNSSSQRRKLLEEQLMEALEDENIEAIQKLVLQSREPNILEEVSEKVEHMDLGIDLSSLRQPEKISEGTNPITTTNSSATVQLQPNALAVDNTSEKPKLVFEFPFVPDDPENSLRRDRPVPEMPLREQQLQANAGNCEFNLELDVHEEEWKVGKWRKLVSSCLEHITKINPADREKMVKAAKDKRAKGRMSAASKARMQKALKNQAMLMAMNGTIHSPNCNFSASINVTGIRTDWEQTSGKAINYSFYMMLTCLTQIVILLRQLLHTQSQSAAIRVSLLCIGWQTVIDALHCLVHTYLSLAMHPLFTAFASVAFFKLLIFCVIEMKYMAIIIQARNSSNGGNSAERLRRQIAMLHLRFYVALVGTFLVSFFVTGGYKILYLLALYSFWVPQIIQNIITEARQPMHPHFIYGMSLSRLVAPIYMLAMPNNFLREIYPDSPQSILACELLVLWIGIQTALLVGQSRYGARFMIPAWFLPPRFDYNRPIPASLLPPGYLEGTPSEELQHERGAAPRAKPTLRPHELEVTSTGARKRINGKRAQRGEQGMLEEAVPAAASGSCASFDCVICYNDIDIRNRSGYMLAPCDHIFHKDCLVKWMDVKMECPVCRTKLPTV